MIFCKRLLLLLLLLVLIGLTSCAGDGGGRGSGVSTVQGNIARIVTASGRPVAEPSFLARLVDALSFPAVATARNEVEGIRVIVEGTDFEGVTDPNGVFTVIGTFGGPVGLVFQRPHDGVTARAAIRIPAGGTLTLNNVRIDNRRGEAAAESQAVAFEGLVTDTECESKRIDLVSSSRPGDEEVFSTRIEDEVLRDERGQPVGCEEIESGTALDIEGIVEEDGTIAATEAEVEEKPDKKEKPTPTVMPTETPAPPEPSPTPTAEPQPTATETPVPTEEEPGGVHGKPKPGKGGDGGTMVG